jgi:lipoprotein NlpI
LRFGARPNTQTLPFNRMGANMRRAVLLYSVFAYGFAAPAPSDAQILRRADDMAPVAAPVKPQPGMKSRAAPKPAAATQREAAAPKSGPKDVADCAQERDHERAVAGCTRLIEDGRQKPKGRASAYYNRGNAHAAKGDHDAAIADYDAAIKLEPKNARAYNNRGAVRGDKGESEAAIADFDAALKQDARFASAYFNRANVHAAKGETDRAIKDYDAAIRLSRRNVNAYIARGAVLLASGATAKARADMKLATGLDRKNAYAALWHDIAARRGKQQGALSRATKGLDMKAWPAPVIQLFTGELQPDAVLLAADNSDLTLKAAQTCEANFYSGEFALIGGNRDEAVKLFRLAAKDCPRGFLEGIAAAAELKGLGEKL